MKDPSVSENDLLDAQLAQVVDEFQERVQRGEQPALAEFVERYPHLGSLLERILPALQELRPIAEDAAPTVPECLGDYRLLRRIGAGGMGVVYEAEQMSLARRVAVKVLPLVAMLDPRGLQRFQYEAQAAAHLHHPHIVPVFGIGCAQGIHYFAMQFIDGRSLADVIEERRRPPLPEASTPGGVPGVATGKQTRWPGKPAAEPSGKEADATYIVSLPASALVATTRRETRCGSGVMAERLGRGSTYFRTVAQLGVQAATGLEHAHQFGIVHRDIKPANLLLEERAGDVNPLTLWITDFGVARIKDQPGLTASGEQVGTPRYMSPEQVRGKPALVDHRTDIYSLGATLYELLTLEPLFAGTTREELMHQIVLEEPRPLRAVEHAIPRDLETIVLKAIAKNPAERYATAQELADDLQRFLEDQPIQARRPGLRERAAKWARRHQAVVRIGGVFLCLALIGLAVSSFLIWQKNQQYLAQLDRARAERQEAREALNRLVEEIAAELDPVLQDELLRSAQTRPLQRLIPHQIRLLEQALQSYAKNVPAPDADPEEQQGYERARLNYGRAHVEIGNLRRLLAEPGSRSEAKAAYEKAITIFQQLTEASPDNRLFRMNLARSYRYLGDLQLESNESAEAVRNHAEKAVVLDERLVADFPDYLAYQQDLALSRTQLGLAFQRLARWDTAAEQFRQALDLWATLLRQKPHPDFRDGQAKTAFALALLLMGRRHHSEAVEVYRTAAQAYQELLAEFPEAVTYRQNLAVALLNLAVLLKETQQAQAAEPTYVKALVHFEKLADDFPKVPYHQYALASALFNQGLFLKERLLPYTVACVGQPPWSCLLPVQVQHEGFMQALHRFEGAYKIVRRLRDTGSGTAVPLRDYWLICRQLAASWIELGDHVRGAEITAELGRIPIRSPAALVVPARLTAQCLALARSDPRLTAAQRQQCVAQDTRQGLDLLRRAVKQGYKDVEKFQSDPALAPLRAAPEFAAWWRQQQEAR